MKKIKFYLISFSNSNFTFTEACTVNQITNADTCQDCSVGEVPDVMSNLTACVACNSEEITNNGLCQACSEGQVPNANQTVCEVAPTQAPLPFNGTLRIHQMFLPLSNSQSIYLHEFRIYKSFYQIFIMISVSTEKNS